MEAVHVIYLDFCEVIFLGKIGDILRYVATCSSSYMADW